MASVRFEEVSKYFADVPAVSELSISVSDGEFIVLVGPSGSGKTTALRMLAGLEAPTGGRLLIDEHVVNDISPRDRNIAMVFQDYALYPQMSVRANLSFGLKTRRAPKSEIASRVSEAAAILGIEDILERKPRQLSGGQRQRVALGRALVRHPSAFLMDEPLSNLDAKLRVQMRAEIKRLQRELGTTTVYVTHDQVEAMTMGDRIAIMHRGRLVQVGDSNTVYEQPVNAFVASFIGSPAMALNEFSASANGAGTTLSRGAVRISVPHYSRIAKDTLILGVRPDGVCLWDRDGGLFGPISGSVAFSEVLGHETFVGVDCDRELAFTIAVPGRHQLDPGTTIEFGLRPGHLHVFDPDDETAIARM